MARHGSTHPDPLRQQDLPARDLPSSTAQYCRSYERTTGVSEMIAQHNDERASKVIVARNVEQRGIGPVSLVSAQYHERFCFAGNENIETLGGVEKILNLAERNRIYA